MSSDPGLPLLLLGAAGFMIYHLRKARRERNAFHASARTVDAVVVGFRPGPSMNDDEATVAPIFRWLDEARQERIAWSDASYVTSPYAKGDRLRIMMDPARPDYAVPVQPRGNDTDLNIVEMISYGLAAFALLWMIWP